MREIICRAGREDRDEHERGDPSDTAALRRLFGVGFGVVC